MIGMGVIGTGIMGKLFARLIAEHEQLELVGVCNRSPESAREIGDKYGVPHFTNPDDLLALEYIDAVYVATPDFAHTEITQQAIAAGLHVLVEKPLTMNVEEALELEAAVKSAGVKGMVRLGNRFSPPFMAAKRAFEAGEHGNIISIKGYLNDSITVPTRMIRWSAKTTPGWFLLSHVLDLASWFAGAKAKTVYARGRKQKLSGLGIDTYDAIQVSVEYENGIIGQFESNWTLPEALPQVFDLGFEICGEDGIVKINTHSQMITSVGERYTYPGTLMSEVDGKLEGYLVYSLDVFARCIAEDKPSPIPFAEGVENVRVLSALHRSLQTDQPEEVH